MRVRYFDKDYPRLEKTTKGDWIDLRSRENVELKAGGHYMIPLGVAIELPAGYEAIVAPRSSAFRRYGFLQTNSIGVIDETYCGDSDEWMLSVYATRDAVIEKYDRICQFRIMQHQPAVTFEEVESLENASRGGFGSTGINELEETREYVYYWYHHMAMNHEVKLSTGGSGTFFEHRYVNDVIIEGLHDFDRFLEYYEKYQNNNTDGLLYFPEEIIVRGKDGQEIERISVLDRDNFAKITHAECECG